MNWSCSAELRVRIEFSPPLYLPFVDGCPTAVDKGFFAQKALSTAFIPSKIHPNVRWNGSASDYYLHLMPSCMRDERWQWLLVLINYTINIRIFVCKRTNTLTNEYPNIRYIHFSTSVLIAYKLPRPWWHPQDLADSYSNDQLSKVSALSQLKTTPTHSLFANCCN